jgi:hypothetical protein
VTATKLGHLMRLACTSDATSASCRSLTLSASLTALTGTRRAVATGEFEIPVIALTSAEATELLKQLNAGEVDGLTEAQRDYFQRILGAAVDSVPPKLAWSSETPADGRSYDYGDLPTQSPACSATDSGTGVDETGCVVTGYSVKVGTHTVTATAQDRASNVVSQSRTYTVRPWQLKGFFDPLRMSEVNAVKPGSAVPLKFTVTKRWETDH